MAMTCRCGTRTKRWGETVCPQCGSRKVERNAEGELECQACGYVLDDQFDVEAVRH